MKFLKFLKRHAFLLFFLVVQTLFLVWTVSALSGTGSSDGAEAAGSAIAGGIIFLLWGLADIILGVTYGVYKLATRSKK